MSRLELTDTDEVRKLLKNKPPLPTTQDGLEALQQVVDRAVRGSRDQYWCERLESMLEATVPQMAAADGHFYASDDMDCRKKKLGQGDKAFNDMGYNSNGVDRDGWDRRGNPPPNKNGGDGFMPNGFTRAYDKDGHDHLGFNYNGIDREGKRRKGRGPSEEEEAAAKGLLNPTTGVLGPDGKLHPKGTTFDTTEVKAPVKRAVRKVAVNPADLELRAPVAV
jgi:hypothetical protein